VHHSEEKANPRTNFRLFIGDADYVSFEHELLDELPPRVDDPMLQRHLVSLHQRGCDLYRGLVDYYLSLEKRFTFDPGTNQGQEGMAVVLVVGATGQLGRAIVWRLSKDGVPLRALVRPTSNVSVLVGSGAELVRGICGMRSPCGRPVADATRS